MIRVAPKPEASDFDSRVRQPGLTFLDEKGIMEGMEAPENFDWKNLWSHALEDLFDDYQEICAYTCFRMEYSLGGVTVDHFLPKKLYPRKAYDWDNYRLAAHRINSRKGNHEDVIDPFRVQNGWFQINFATGKIYPDAGLPEATQLNVHNTIDRLKLNEHRLKRKRTEFFDRYLNRNITLDTIKTDAPHVHQEILRQNLHA
jgi:uncharacterized protein (TIGR02646 family)